MSHPPARVACPLCSGNPDRCAVAGARRCPNWGGRWAGPVLIILGADFWRRAAVEYIDRRDIAAALERIPLTPSWMHEGAA
jgi:hypothetical protein